ncbi:hypothetical protein [Bradyrhizobium genosp. A]|uniref:hypothetical protein n=1 Tax=Bradyrhizobium genosp. A TaxID=83626 RepID=UPI003CF0858D
MHRFRHSGIGIGFSIAGHAIIALLLMLEIFARIDSLPSTEIPVEIVIEKPAEARSQKATSNEQNRSPAYSPAVADAEKRAKAPLAVLNANGLDQPKPPGRDGSDPNSDVIGLPWPVTGSGLAAGTVPAPSKVVIAAPVGPALPQITAREPGENEWTALAEQKVQCGIMAKRSTQVVATRIQAKVLGIPTEAQSLAATRSTQASLDRHMNPNYVRSPGVFVENMDGASRATVKLPSGFTANPGDIIEYDRGHMDPSDPCQYIPNLAVRKL